MPTLAAIAPFADGPVRIEDVYNTRVKECDRLDACAQNLRAIGVPVQVGRDWIEIHPARPRAGAHRLPRRPPHRDGLQHHRTAHPRHHPGRPGMRQEDLPRLPRRPRRAPDRLATRPVTVNAAPTEQLPSKLSQREKTRAALQVTTRLSTSLLCLLAVALPLSAQTATTHSSNTVSEADRLRGGYGPIAPTTISSTTTSTPRRSRHKTIAGKNPIRFKMLQDGTRIQIDLRDILKVDKSSSMKDRTQIHPPGRLRLHRLPPNPQNGPNLLHRLLLLRHPPPPSAASARLVFQQGPHGRPWIYTACEEEGASHLVAQQRPVER